MKGNPSIRIGHLKIVDHLILGLVDRQLKQNEISLAHSNLEINAMNAWDQVCDGLKEGEIKGAFIPAPIAMDLFASGLDIKLLMFAHRSGSVIVKNQNLDTNSIIDFKDKTVLVPSELSIQNMLLHRLFSSAKLTFGDHNDTSMDVTREIVNPFLMNEMLINDKDNDIAGFAVAEPFGAQAVIDKIAIEVCTSHDLWKDHPCCVFVLKSSFIEQNHSAVQEIISLFIQAGQSIEQSKNDKKIVSMAQDFLDQNPEVIEHALLKTKISFHPSLLVPDIDALNIIQNYMADSIGVLKNKIDINNFVDSSFTLNIIAENRF